MDMIMDIKNQIDWELKEIYISEDLKRRIRTKAKKRKPYQYIKGIVASFVILIFGGTTVFAGYYIYNKVMVNEEILPELDDMYCVQTNKLNMAVDEYGIINAKIDNYQVLQNKLGIKLLSSKLSEENSYMQGKIKTNNKSFAIVSFKNYILGDTKNYSYVVDEDFYTYDHGIEYYSPISLKVEIILNEIQMENGWDIDYLGMYQFKENYISLQGYKVNLLEDTIKNKTEHYISQKCAIFVADGIRYTLKGRTSFENMKYIVDTME